MTKADFHLGDLCIIEYDSKLRYIKETIKGKWSREFYNKYNKYYKESMNEAVIEMKQWCKVIDMRGYEISSVIELVREHLSWCISNGLVHCIFIVSTPIIKIQMRRCTRDLIPGTFFYNEEDAMNYLKTLKF